MTSPNWKKLRHFRLGLSPLHKAAPLHRRTFLCSPHTHNLVQRPQIPFFKTMARLQSQLTHNLLFPFQAKNTQIRTKTVAWRRNWAWCWVERVSWKSRQRHGRRIRFNMSTRLMFLLIFLRGWWTKGDTRHNELWRRRFSQGLGYHCWYC